MGSLVCYWYCDGFGRLLLVGCWLFWLVVVLVGGVLLFYGVVVNGLCYVLVVWLIVLLVLVCFIVVDCFS